MLDRKILFSLIRHPVRFLHVFLYKMNVFNTPKRVTITTSFGKTMTIVLPELVSMILYLTDEYEPEVKDMLTQFLKKGDTFVDIGAHIGYFTLLGATLVGKKGRVYSFEPTTSTFDVLRYNCKSEKNIMLINKAVFSKKKQLYLQDFGPALSALNSFYSPRINKNIKGSRVKVEATGLDTFFSTLKKPDFIKIDAESSECDIIKGMRGILRSKKPVLCIEFGGIYSEKKRNEELVNILSELKYDIFIHKNNMMKRFSNNIKNQFYTNLLCIPKKSNHAMN